MTSAHKIRLSPILYLLFYLIRSVAAQCSSNTKPTNALSPLVLYMIGDESYGNRSHILSPHSDFESSAASVNFTVRFADQLDAKALTSDTNVGCSCTTRVITVTKLSSDFSRLTISHTTDVFLNNWIDAGFQASPDGTFYCVKNKNECKADVGLYLYKSNTSEDYYVSTENKGPQFGEEPYSLHYPPNRPDLYGIPLCYVWLDTSLTTTTTTKATTTTSANEAAMTTVSDKNDTSDATIPSETLTSTKSSEEDQTRDKKWKSSWWKWVAGLCAGLFMIGICCIAVICCTMMFISPASKITHVVKYSGEPTNSRDVLPPQPVQAAATGQQLPANFVPLPPGYVPS